MGKRNTYGTGSLFYNKAKTRWVVAIAQPPTIDGKRRRLQRSFRTKQEAFEYFNEAQHGIGDGRTLLLNLSCFPILQRQICLPGYLTLL